MCLLPTQTQPTRQNSNHQSKKVVEDSCKYTQYKLTGASLALIRWDNSTTVRTFCNDKTLKRLSVVVPSSVRHFHCEMMEGLFRLPYLGMFRVRERLLPKLLISKCLSGDFGWSILFLFFLVQFCFTVLLFFDCPHRDILTTLFWILLTVALLTGKQNLHSVFTLLFVGEKLRCLFVLFQVLKLLSLICFMFRLWIIGCCCYH